MVIPLIHAVRPTIVGYRIIPHWFHHTRILMARDPIVNQVLMMLMLSATVSAPVQVGLSVTLITTALIPMTTWTIIQRPISAQPLVVLPPRTDVVALRRLDQINIMVTSAHELTQKMQMVPRYRSGGAMYPVFLLGPVLEYLFLAWVPL